MGQYRKKPMVIDSVQWTGRNYEDMESFITVEFGYKEKTDQSGAILIIPTLEGEMEAQPNDYIIRGIKGEFYPCKPDIFETSYEAV